MEREAGSEKFPLGSKIPEFSLSATDGNTVSNADLVGSKASLVIFTCNHCPYVIGSEKLLNATISNFLDRGLKVAAICSNDAVTYPDDSFEKMKEKSESLNLPYPYLHDESQEVARLFDAACTPELYLFDGEGSLVWHGAPNNSPRDPGAATDNYLELALSQLLAGEMPKPSYVRPQGCSIKWR